MECNYFHVSPTNETVDALGVEDSNVVFVEEEHISRHQLHLAVLLVLQKRLFQSKHVSREDYGFKCRVKRRLDNETSSQSVQIKVVIEIRRKKKSSAKSLLQQTWVLIDFSYVEPVIFFLTPLKDMRHSPLYNPEEPFVVGTYVNLVGRVRKFLTIFRNQKRKFELSHDADFFLAHQSLIGG